MENLSGLANTSRNGNAAAVSGKRTVEETYKKISQLEHILLRPDTYIGSAERSAQTLWIWDDVSSQMVQREASFVPGLYKIFDEILVNAADHRQRDRSMNTLEVWIDGERGRISVCNNGSGIPVELHRKEGIYVPELIFGHLLTSSNYDDDDKKVVGGRNGYGAKLANIFSTEFVVETADQSSNCKYRQVFRRNMTYKEEPVITRGLKKNEQYTRISFQPDLSRFGLTHLDNDMVSLMKKRAIDVAGCSPGVKVFLNGEQLAIRSFRDYVALYQAEAGTAIHERCSERWEVAICPSDGQFQQVSFVNSIWTIKGGTHVTHVTDQIVARIIEHVTKKHKDIKIKPFQVKSQLSVFVNCLVENPAFDSQTKETLTSRASSFGSSCSLSDDVYKKVLRSPIIDNLLAFAKFKQSNELKKTDGGKTRRLLGIPKLDDANFAGTRDSASCTLILTEGDSAKSFAVSGFSVVGRDYYGVFPLRGKLLNVREASHKQIMDNPEINNLKKIIGLQHNKVYDAESRKTLRYGRVVVMTDQDHDGSHIKGLLVNFFHCFWPSLIQMPRFLSEFITPIVKCTERHNTVAFFTIPQYNAWRESLGDRARHWTCKYYKGLGTSSSAEAKEYFSNLGRHVIDFQYGGEEDVVAIDMAFSKQRVQQRKEWLASFREGTFFDYERDVLTYANFINKELILFSVADNERSIPSLMDGLKPSQRKVLYGCFRRKLSSEVKVAQLVGYVSEHTAYHHGETSLMSTIIGLAQSFVGSNNLNMLQPAGQFGTRLQGGRDAASARYIFTRLTRIARLVFPPADDNLLEYLYDDSQRIEPKWYAPVLPMVLVNGADGIGTGWSSSIPPHNPRDIIALLRQLLNGASPDELPELQPWFRGFEGTIRRGGTPSSFDMHGCVRRLSGNSLQVTELPARSWTSPYKEWLESVTVGAASAAGGGGGGDGASKSEPPFIQELRDDSTETRVRFNLVLGDEEMRACEEVGVHKRLKLSTTIATSNMVVFDTAQRLTRYDTSRSILLDFYTVRLQLYEKRRLDLLRQLQEDVLMLENKTRFILMVVDGKLQVAKRRRGELVGELERLRFKPSPPAAMRKQHGGGGGAGTSADAEGDELDGEDEIGGSDHGKSGAGDVGDRRFNYLLSMPLWSLTVERVEHLCAQRDDKIAEAQRMESMTAHMLYLDDLTALEAELDRSDEERAKEAEEVHHASRKAARAQQRVAAVGGRGKKSTAALKVARELEDERLGEGEGELIEPPEAKVKVQRRAVTKPAKGTVEGASKSALPLDGSNAFSSTSAIDAPTFAPPIASLQLHSSTSAALVTKASRTEKGRRKAGELAASAIGQPSLAATRAGGKTVFNPGNEDSLEVSDDEHGLGMTLSERLARKMHLHEGQLTAKRSDAVLSSAGAGANPKRNRPQKAPSTKITAELIVPSPTGKTPEPKRKKQTVAKPKPPPRRGVVSRGDLGRVNNEADSSDNESDDDAAASTQATGRGTRPARTRKPTTTYKELIHVDDTSRSDDDDGDEEEVDAADASDSDDADYE